VAWNFPFVSRRERDEWNLGANCTRRSRRETKEKAWGPPVGTVGTFVNNPGK